MTFAFFGLYIRLVANWGCRLGMAALVVTISGAALAAETVASAPTEIAGTADRLISYRHQEHMWQTADGASHVVVNLGGGASADSLVMYSSYDGGATWMRGLSLLGTKYVSTSDGLLLENTLSLVLSTWKGEIRYASLLYRPEQRLWSRQYSEIAASLPGATLMNPALTVDGQGGVWVGYVLRDNATQNAGIRMAYRSPTGGWQDTGLSFGADDNQSIERSARPVVIAGGVGMVYTVHEGIYWASRQDSDSPQTPWSIFTLYTSPPPYDTDPYASHFSIVADDEGNQHLFTVDQGHLLYLRYEVATEAWNAPWVLTRDISAGYVQVSWALGNLVVVVNAQTVLRVFQSADRGASFYYTHLLTHPSPTAGDSYAHPRVETPSRSASPVPVFQQYVNGSQQRLLFFAVPVVAPATP